MSTSASHEFASSAVSTSGKDKGMERQPYDFRSVVVNFNNVGTTFGKRSPKNTLKGSAAARDTFNWEGVRRCVKACAARGLEVTGVIFENWLGIDETPFGVRDSKGVPDDIKAMCKEVVEAPRCEGPHHRNADQEVMIKCAFRRNCLMLDNDNHRDWLRSLRDEKIRDWLGVSMNRIHVGYYFDKGAGGTFEILDGNAIRGASEERGGKRRRLDRTSEAGVSVAALGGG
eukprot:gnl/TRDRNA2_/TRDRNA2_156155_c1_seq3.p1 gnl/TRDRNA2_/TRDRNA2_156155_c1~~gnl/TRDRNA2_/TRDRNA2_156155_c1_seq3.p1  ORF type:complete len:229 (+),score=43.40 gnl/TRDRNA2_/TRDRNA2_156155_c1_seq3:299-985(+)